MSMSAQTATIQDANILGAGDPARPPRTPMQIAMGRLRKSPLAIGGIIVLTIIVAAALFAPVLTDYGQNEIDLFSINAKPSSEHLLGTRSRTGCAHPVALWRSTLALDRCLGRDSDHDSRSYRRSDLRLLRGLDRQLAHALRRSDARLYPSLFVLLILAAMLDEISVTLIILFLGCFGWMWLARIIRGDFLTLKARRTEAARSIGVPDRWIIIRHLMPNVVGPIIVTTTLDIALYMLAEASLSFLGFGVPSRHTHLGKHAERSASLLHNPPVTCDSARADAHHRGARHQFRQ